MILMLHSPPDILLLVCFLLFKCYIEKLKVVFGKKRLFQFSSSFIFLESELFLLSSKKIPAIHVAIFDIKEMYWNNIVQKWETFKWQK